MLLAVFYKVPGDDNGFLGLPRESQKVPMYTLRSLQRVSNTVWRVLSWVPRKIPGVLRNSHLDSHGRPNDHKVSSSREFLAILMSLRVITRVFLLIRTHFTHFTHEVSEIHIPKRFSNVNFSWVPKGFPDDTKTNRTLPQWTTWKSLKYLWDLWKSL